MRSSRFTEYEIAIWLADAERGRSIDEICHDARISQRTFYRWREKFGELPVSGIQTLKRLEEENRKFKTAMTLSGAALTLKPQRSPTRWPWTLAPAASGRPSTRTSSAYRNCRSH